MRVKSQIFIDNAILEHNIFAFLFSKHFLSDSGELPERNKMPVTRGFKKNIVLTCHTGTQIFCKSLVRDYCHDKMIFEIINTLNRF